MAFKGFLLIGQVAVLLVLWFLAGYVGLIIGAVGLIILYYYFDPEPYV